jgi:hypothetical protein
MGHPPDNNSRTSPQTRAEIMTNPVSPVVRTIYYAYLCPCPQFFSLPKTIANVCTPRSIGFLSHVSPYLPNPTFFYTGCHSKPCSFYRKILLLCQLVQDYSWFLRDLKMCCQTLTTNNGQLGPVVFLGWVDGMGFSSAGTSYFFLILLSDLVFF